MARDIGRQAFVRGALAAAAGAALGSCRSPTASGPQSPPMPAAPPDWTALAGQLDGRLVLPSGADYGTAKRVFNARFDASTPAAVVAVTSTEDVAKALAFAARNGTRVVARSGGHSYVGASAANGTMVIDLRRLPTGAKDDEANERVTVGAATPLGDVQTTLAASGRSIPTGSCPTVGVSGLTLGGGLGSDARQHGLTCDALVSATVVLPDGEVVTADVNDHAELFWALRGGGSGCSVVTSLTFRTFPTSDRDVVTLGFPARACASVILGWHDWLDSADRSVWGMVNVGVGPGGARCTVVLATPPGRGPAIANQLLAGMGVKPVSNTSRTLSRLDFVHYFEGGAQASRPRVFVAGSDVIEQMTPAAVAGIVAATADWPSATGSATAVIESLSGAVGDVAAGSTAFPWRRQAACIQWYAETPNPSAVTAAERWVASAHQAVQASSVGGYVNYLEPQTPAARYFAGNLDRLRAVRQRYDPDGLMYSSLRL